MERILKALLGSVLAVSFAVTAYASETIQLGGAPTAVTLLGQDNSGLTMRVEIGAISLTRVATVEGNFVLVTVDGFARSQEIGKPNLPTANRLLAIPVGCELSATAQVYDPEEISLTDLGYVEPLIPVQPSLSKSQAPEDVPFEYDRLAYQQPGFYSLPLVSTEALGEMRAVRLGLVSVAPIEYNPMTNTVRIYKRVDIQVTYNHPDWPATMETHQQYYSPAFEPVYSQIFNYEPLPPEILDDLVVYPIKYVIVSDRMFETQLQPFIEWKTKKGFKVITGYTDVIGYSAFAIKTFLRDLYTNGSPEDPAPSFVLLVGDTPLIPTFNGSAGSHVTDLRFCEFTNDNFPEIYYGRWSAQNTGQLQPQIDKTLEYEQYTMPDPSYLGEVTLIAGVDANYAPTHGNGQINYGRNLYFNLAHGIVDHTWLYPQSDAPGAAAAIIQTVNEGIGFINYTAHGSHDGWADPAFTVADIYGLTNAHKYLLSVGNCCLTNTFDESTPCFGEAWLQAPNKGGVGYIGGSNSTYWNEDYWWGVGYGPVVPEGPRYEETGLGAYDGVFHDHGEPITEHYVTNDAMIFCGNMAVTESGSDMTQYYWEIYHLMGDPSVMNFMGVPSVNNVQHGDSVMMTAPFFTVRADPASYVGISMNGVLHGAAYVDETGAVDVPLAQFEQPGTADIVVTAQNRQPYVHTITVATPEGAYVIYDTCMVNDTLGNGDGRVDFGETILLCMGLCNVGPDTAYDVVATLRTEDQHITITDSVETFGTIIGNFGTVYVANAYAFNVSNQIPDGEVISFNVEIVSLTDTWSGHFSLGAHAPVVEFVDMAINDDSGNGNGIFEAGETIQVTVTLENSGSSMAGAVSGLLSETDDYVIVTDADGTFGNLAPGAQGNNASDVFVVVADSTFPPGHSVLFDLAVSANGGYNSNLQFILRALESFEYNDGHWVGEGVWEWGVPTSGPNVAYDGEKAWATVLGGNYPDDVDDDLVTPYFSITSTTASMSFYHWYSMEDSYDGGNIQASTDGGQTWTVLTPQSGYPDNSVVGLDGQPGFTGQNGAWEEVVVDLSAYNGQTIKLKLRFGSDGSVTRPGWYVDAVVLTGAINWGALEAAIRVEPLALSATLQPGQSTTRTVSVFNDGPGLLEFSAAAITDERLLAEVGQRPKTRITDHIKKRLADGLSYYDYVGPKSTDKSGEGELTTDFGGPDAFGYTWRDSNEPDGPVFSWVDITGNGTQITGLDDDTNVGPFAIGFEFPFYGNTFTTFRFCTNGYISFTSSEAEYDNVAIPNNDEPYNMVAPFWDDLTFTSSGQAYYYSSGDSLVVSYIDVPHFTSGGPYTFQVILLAGGDITLQYQSIGALGNSNTIGIQNENSSIGLQVANNQDYAAPDLAVELRYPSFWLAVSPGGGFLFPTEAAELEVAFDAAELDSGRFTGQILLSSNDPDDPTVSVPCTLTVGTVGIEDDYGSSLPTTLSLQQNYPNPFNPVTRITFGLPQPGRARLEVYDIAGRKVKTVIDKVLSAGVYQFVWDGTDDSGNRIASGLYLYRLVTGEHEIVKKMVMVK